jgi:branched-chain amino acid transport system substrate-binding protein
LATTPIVKGAARANRHSLETREEAVNGRRNSIPRQARRRAAWAGAAALVIGLAPAAAAAKDPVQVGVAAGLTGYLAAFDGQFVTGAKLGATHVNDAGGADGHTLELHVLDDASNATTGVTDTNQLLNQYNVSVMLNGLSSAQNAAIEPILARAKVPQIVISVLPPDPVWAFQANLPNEKADALELDYAKQGLHATKVAILFSHTPYGQNGAKFMAGYAQKLGLAVVFSEGVEPSATDMTGQMARLKDTGPDAVLDILTGSTHIVEAKAAATVGLTVPVVMAQDDIPTIAKATASYAQTYFIVTAVQAYPNIADPALKAACEAFLADYKKAGLDPAAMTGASFGWDAVKILAAAIAKSGATGGDALRTALETVTVQGTNTLYQFSPADHTGQTDVASALQIGALKGSAVEIAFPKK